MIKIQKLKTIFVLCCLLFIFTPTLGAEIFFDSKIKEINFNTEFQVDIFLNTKGESINAVGGVLQFPADILEFKKIKDGNSIVNFWLEQPDFNGEDKIIFSGITPGGFLGNQGFLFSVIFLAKKKGISQIEIQEINAFLNDGQGTAVEVFVSPLNIFITDKELFLPIKEFKDYEPPELFVPKISADPSLFNGQWFLVFATQDKGVGIDKYLIYESQRIKKRIAVNDWVESKSPHLLKDQKLKSYIYVKALDKNGNERISIVEPRYPLKWYEKWESWVMIMVIIAIIIFIAGMVLRKKYAHG